MIAHASARGRIWRLTSRSSTPARTETPFPRSDRRVCAARDGPTASSFDAAFDCPGVLRCTRAHRCASSLNASSAGRRQPRAAARRARRRAVVGVSVVVVQAAAKKHSCAVRAPRRAPLMIARGRAFSTDPRPSPVSACSARARALTARATRPRPRPPRAPPGRPPRPPRARTARRSHRRRPASATPMTLRRRRGAQRAYRDPRRPGRSRPGPSEDRDPLRPPDRDPTSPFASLPLKHAAKRPVVMSKAALEHTSPRRIKRRAPATPTRYDGTDNLAPRFQHRSARCSLEASRERERTRGRAVRAASRQWAGSRREAMRELRVGRGSPTSRGGGGRRGARRLVERMGRARGAEQIRRQPSGAGRAWIRGEARSCRGSAAHTDAIKSTFAARDRRASAQVGGREGTRGDETF